MSSEPALSSNEKALTISLLVVGGIFSVIYLRILSKSEPVR